MDNKLVLAIVITLLLAILSGVNALQPSAPVVLTEKPPLKQKLAFRFLHPAPAPADPVR
jgi:hypothetical protein